MAGVCAEDFTYVGDVSEAVARMLDFPPTPNPLWSSEAPDPASSSAPWRVYNIGNRQPVAVLDIVSLIEKEMGKSAKRELLPMQPGDVRETYADAPDRCSERKLPTPGSICWRTFSEFCWWWFSSRCADSTINRRLRIVAPRLRPEIL
jgi:hypothetical protein